MPIEPQKRNIVQHWWYEDTNGELHVAEIDQNQLVLDPNVYDFENYSKISDFVMNPFFVRWVCEAPPPEL